MKFQNRMSKVFYTAATLGFLLGVVGCGNEPASGPLSPVKSAAPGKTSLAKAGDEPATGTITPLTRKTRSANGYGGTASKLMTASAGGSLSYMGHTMEVPKFAFSEQQKEFFITDVSSNWIQADYGPSGWFLEPVKITISYADADLRNVDLKRLTVAWYSDALGMWIDVGGSVDRVNKTISVYVWHFTQYTISTK